MNELIVCFTDECPSSACKGETGVRGFPGLSGRSGMKGDPGNYLVFDNTCIKNKA